MDPAIKVQLTELTVSPLMAAETEKWAKVIELAGIKAE
jgi:hypothetical protein